MIIDTKGRLSECGVWRKRGVPYMAF